MAIDSSQRGSKTGVHLSRRGFLKMNAAAAGTAAFGRPVILSGAEVDSTAANSRLNLAVVGCGGQGRGRMRGMLSGGANLVALCDPDREMIDKCRADALKSGGDATKSAKAYEDYRQLLDNAPSFDAVLVATPDHWHAHLCKAFNRGRQTCLLRETPCPHSVAEARALRELVRKSKVVTPDGQPGQRQPVATPRHRDHPGRRAGADPRDLPVGFSAV